jgi:hypothetical protein
MIGRKWVTLDTYKYSAPKRVGIDGESKQVSIPKEWLARQLAPMTLEEFVDEYTYDDSEYWYHEYLKRGVTENA